MASSGVIYRPTGGKRTGRGIFYKSALPDNVNILTPYLLSIYIEIFPLNQFPPPTIPEGD